jgi:hypothetical protein
MRGGLVETDRQVLTGLGFTDEQINYLFANNPDMMIEFFQNSINPPPGNPFYTEAQTPDQIIQSLVDINNEYDGNNSEGHTTAEARSIMSELGATNNSFDNNYNSNLNNADLDISTISAIPGSEQNTLSDDSSVNPLELGGKRKSKRRSSTKKSKKSKKTKKSRKTRKNKKRKHRGGADTPSMTTEYLNVNDRDKKDYDQMLNTLNWNPKQ